MDGPNAGFGCYGSSRCSTRSSTPVPQTGRQRGEHAQGGRGGV